jgi:putative DNA methylase
LNDLEKRLIEDYLPIEHLSAEAVSEKSARQAHISMLHLWWARRPLVAARAAVYGALASAPLNSEERSSAAAFIKALCVYPGDEAIFAKAREQVLAAHRARTGLDTPPKVLDLFSGGGAISLEALRLGGDAFANELNPVAYLINLCTLVYPQKYGANDIHSVGSDPDGKWAGMAAEVRHWGSVALAGVREKIGDLYPLAKDPNASRRRELSGQFWVTPETVPSGFLVPSAYIWTRTVTCKKPGCGATIPLARQTWLCRKSNSRRSRFVGVDGKWNRSTKKMKFRVVEAEQQEDLGFDPSAGSRGGETVCPECRASIDDQYVKAESCAGRLGIQLMAVVCEPPEGTGKQYINPDKAWESAIYDRHLGERAEKIANDGGFSLPDEPLEANPRSFDVQHFGFARWRDVFTPRQLVAVAAFTSAIRISYDDMVSHGYMPGAAKAVATCLSMALGRLINQCTSLCRWQPEFVAGMLGDAGLPMIMDFAEVNPLANSSGAWVNALEYVCGAITSFSRVPRPATVVRGSALNTAWPDNSFDAIVTDPPYYDSRSYSNLSDHFYVWHKRAVGHLYPADFASQLTPKKNEAIAAAYRHGGDWKAADVFYERAMQMAFAEAHRLLKSGAPMVCVYAHKTTSGWTTLINAMRSAGFSVVEAWPIEMERKVRQNALETAALASSILLVARRRDETEIGSYEKVVRPELETTVRERVETLWSSGIQGADLVVATVGAGLRAFTRFARVEFDNGEEVPAGTFLAEVETVVLDSILERLSEAVGANENRYTLTGIDTETRFYVLWRYTYRWSELDAGDAIIFANGTHLELEQVCAGTRPLIEKKKGKYRLLTYADRGGDSRLGTSMENGDPAPLVDVLHRLLWLMESRPREIEKFLRDVRPNREQLRLLAQALAGPAIRGGELSDVSPTGELSVLTKLIANWRSVVEDAAIAPAEREDRRTGQSKLHLERGDRP